MGSEAKRIYVSGGVAMGPGKATLTVAGRVVHAQPGGLVTCPSGGMPFTPAAGG